MPTWERFPIWDEWKKWTRFAALMDYSLEASATLWKSLPVKDRDHVTIQRNFSGSRFACPGSAFLPILEDRHAFSSLLLLSSWSLIEGHVDEVIDYMVCHGVITIPLVNERRSGITTSEDFFKGGVETWGAKLLMALGRDWSDIQDGKAGIVEVSLVRNALAHGKKQVDQSMLNRFTGAGGGSLPWQIGADISLDLARTRLYRDRMRSFARVISTAAVNSTRAVISP